MPLESEDDARKNPAGADVLFRDSDLQSHAAQGKRHRQVFKVLIVNGLLPTQREHGYLGVYIGNCDRVLAFAARDEGPGLD